MLEKIFPKIHAEGYKFLAIAIFVTIFLYFLSYFFRINWTWYYQYGFIIFLEIQKEFQ